MTARARVSVKLTIETEVEIVDSGYLGVGATVEEHIKQAKEKVSHWQLLIQQGSLEPKRQKATFHVNKVIIEEVQL